jgi:Bacterial regulatory protein, Fis family
MDEHEPGEEYKLLLRDLRQAARTVLDVRGKKAFAVGMFLSMLRHEAMMRTDGKRAEAAELLGEHRNTFTRGLPEEERKMRERYAQIRRRPRVTDSGASRMQQTLL